MKRCKPNMWTPNAIEKDTQLFNNVMGKAEEGSSFGDIEKGRLDLSRFAALSSYFHKLSVELACISHKGRVLHCSGAFRGSVVLFERGTVGWRRFVAKAWPRLCLGAGFAHGSAGR